MYIFLLLTQLSELGPLQHHQCKKEDGVWLDLEPALWNWKQPLPLVVAAGTPANFTNLGCVFVPICMHALQHWSLSVHVYVCHREITRSKCACNFCPCTFSPASFYLSVASVCTCLLLGAIQNESADISAQKFLTNYICRFCVARRGKLSHLSKWLP